MNSESIIVWIEQIFRRRTLALKVGLLVFGVIAVGSILWPPTYESTSKILVQSNRAQLLVSPGLKEDAANQATQTVPVAEQDLNSEVELLTSPFLVKQALAGMKSNQRSGGVIAGMRNVVESVISAPTNMYLAMHGGPGSNASDDEIQKILHHLSADVIKRSNIIEVGIRSHDPVWARGFLNQLMTSYLALHGRLSQNPQAQAFFQAQRGLLDQRLQESQKELRAAQMQTGIASFSAQQQALITQLSTAEANYRGTGVLLDSRTQQIASQEAELKKTPQRQTKESKTVQNMALQQLKPQMLQLETERAELLSRYQPTSSRIREIDAKLKAGHDILTREKESNVQETTTDVNPTWQALDADLAKARAEAASYKAAQATQLAQIASLREQLKTMTTDGVTIERLERAVESNKEAYLSYVRKGEEARAAEALNQSQILNVSVVQDPTAPLEPISPRIMLNLITGLLFGLILAVAAAHWSEEYDPKICSSASIFKDTGLSTVAILDDRL
ncbi:MAG TPA: GNVR domain-containing protein [Methylomirabilota bacterium]|nr:GNVR domain-containing protein [Methylomirabilota bacterium]